ncbi:MAG: KH domain-containing protein [Verrucomicrobia bacterium]|nr:KH domain-containing protein [Verrucomicrobiota bacterium]
MHKFLELIIKPLVNFPEEVEIDVFEDDHSIVYQLRLNPEDIGRVVGRNGSTINAIRTLMQARPQEDGRRVGLELIEDEYDDYNR